MKRKSPKKWPMVFVGAGLVVAGGWATTLAGLHGSFQLTLLAAAFWFLSLFAFPLFFLKKVLPPMGRFLLLIPALAYTGFVGMEVYKIYNAPPCPQPAISSTRKSYLLALQKLGLDDLSAVNRPTLLFLCSRPFGVLTFVRIEQDAPGHFRLHAVHGRQIPDRPLQIRKEIERPLQTDELNEILRLLKISDFFRLPPLLEAKESSDLSKRKLVLRCLGLKPLECRCANTLFAVEVAFPVKGTRSLQHHLVLRTNKESSEEFRALCNRFCRLAGFPPPGEL